MDITNSLLDKSEAYKITNVITNKMYIGQN